MVWLTLLKTLFHQLLSSQMSQHQLFLPFTSCLCSPRSLLSLYCWFSFIPKPVALLRLPGSCTAYPEGFGQPRHVWDAAWPTPFVTIVRRASWLPRAFGIRPPHPTHTPVLFVMGSVCLVQTGQPLPKCFRQSVPRMLGSPLEAGAFMFWGLCTCSSSSFCLLMSYSSPKAQARGLPSVNLPRPSSLPQPSFTPSCLPEWCRLHSTKLWSQRPSWCLMPHVVPRGPSLELCEL